MSIEKVLVASTAHLTEETKNDLEDEKCVIDDTWYYEYGWGFFIPAIITAFEDERNPPEEIVKIARYALDEECAIVLFDRDGAFLSGFTTYDW